MHVEFDPVKVEWEILLSNGMPSVDLLYGGGGASYCGAGAIMGGGSAQGYTAFSGMPFQRGAGIGGVFRTLMRYLLPIGRAIGREGLETGARVLTGYLGGKDIKETMVHESKAGVKNLLEKAAHNLESEKQTGKGFDFKRYKTNRNNKNNSSEAATATTVRKESIKRTPLHSLMGPSSLPNKPLKKRRKKTTTTTKAGKAKGKSTKGKRLRLDSLGYY